MCHSVENKERGFTLVEVLVGMGVGLIVLGALASVFIIQSRSYDVQEQVTEMVQTARAAIDMVTREVRMAGYDPTGAGIVGLPFTGDLKIVADLNGDGETDGTSTDDDDNEEITYIYDDSTDQITRNTGGGAQPAVENVFDAELEYRDWEGNVLDPASDDEDDVRQIWISITTRTSKPDPNYGINWGYRTYTLSSLITPPNLEMP